MNDEAEWEFGLTATREALRTAGLVGAAPDQVARLRALTRRLEDERACGGTGSAEVLDGERSSSEAGTAG